MKNMSKLVPTQTWRNTVTIESASLFFPSMSLSQVCAWQYLLHITHTLYQHQVCPPGLHITLGIFLGLFVLLEDACHHLDLTAELTGSAGGRSLNATQLLFINREVYRTKMALLNIFFEQADNLKQHVSYSFF